MYHTASPSKLLAITGCCISDVQISKKKCVCIGQKCITIDISLVSYSIDVHALSSDMHSFILPVVFTIGPIEDNDGSMVKYAKLIGRRDKLSTSLKELVHGVIEGEISILAASRNLENIFKTMKDFKKEVFENVEGELQKVGLHVYNANMKRLVTKDHRWGPLEEMEAPKPMEMKKALTRTEKLKAELLSKAQVDHDVQVQVANADLYKKQKEAEATLYRQQKNAEAQKARADANFYARKLAADGNLYTKLKEAEEIVAAAQGISDPSPQ